MTIVNMTSQKVFDASIGKIAIWCQFHIFFKWKFCEEKTIITWFWLAQGHPRQSAKVPFEVKLWLIHKK